MAPSLATEIHRQATAATRPDPRPALRFTVTGSDALEGDLAVLCEKVSAGVRHIIPGQILAGLVLGGGYGRGEGGVLQTPAGDRPYNDLEFYIFVRAHPRWHERRYAKPLHALAETLGLTAGIELEFKITSAAQIRGSPPNLFFHDLVMGHRWLLGDDRLFAGCESHRDARSIPLSEATRLLMNRCSGLLFAREKLAQASFQAADADFVGRNIAKTELALGDAVLIAFGKYHWSCRERGRRLDGLATTEHLPWLAELRQRHAAGVEFKLEPHRSSLSQATLQAHWLEASWLALRVWLWLEHNRLGGDFPCASAYAYSRMNKWPETSYWRNRLANVKVFGLRALLLSARHPRQRILNALALLLWARTESSAETASRARRELQCAEPEPIIPAYRKRWSRAS